MKELWVSKTDLICWHVTKLLQGKEIIESVEKNVGSDKKYIKTDPLSIKAFRKILAIYIQLFIV